MTTTYDTDPNTQTIAVAWASSPLGQPEREVRYGFATTSPTEPVTAFEVQPTVARVMIAAGLACGIAAAALVGVMFFADTDSAQPTVVVPGSGAGLSAPETDSAQQGPADVAVPGDTTVVIDIPIPEPPKRPYVIDPVPAKW
jgi:hypothetical protein